MAIITLGGHLGSGKTTVSGILAKLLGYKELYIGGIMRELAEERAQTIEQFFEDLRNDPALERSIDAVQEKLMREEEGWIIQGRMAWHFSRGSPFRILNIFLAVNPNEGARRMSQRPEYAGKSVEEIKKLADGRVAVERERYNLLYGIPDFLDKNHYDLVIDTTDLAPEEVAKRIVDELNRPSWIT